MDKLTKLFWDQVQTVQNQLQNLLEKDLHSKINTNEPKLPFRATSDLSQLDGLGVGLPENPLLKTEMIFARLLHYFEAGLLFHRAVGSLEWSPIAAFQEGDFLPLTPDDIKLQFSFPEMTLVDVKRVQSPKVFTQLKQIDLIRNEQTNVLIFKPLPCYIFLVTSLLPDIWLKPHVEKIQTKTLLLLSDMA